MIKILGIICIICIFSVTWVACQSVEFTRGNRSIINFFITLMGTLIPSVLIGLFISLQPDREINITRAAYQKGIETHFTFTLDTVWHPIIIKQ